ncbi:MAG: hypothetical protein U0271_05030 [Polyangiaceae bacterium]
MKRLPRQWIGALLLAWVPACGDSDPGVGGAGGGGDGGGGATSAGGDGGAGVESCGPAPLVNVTTRLTDWSTGLPVVGAKLTTDLCPDVELETDASGQAMGRLSANSPYVVGVQAAGFIPILTSEEVVVADFDGGGQLYSTDLLPLLPHWSDSSPTILALMFTDASAGAGCSDPSGWVFGVASHPEAVVTYYRGGAIPQPDPTLTATGPAGVAEISGLAATAPGEWIELSATKAGCEASFVSYPHTGRHRLVNGVLTVAAAFAPPHPTP